MLIRPSYITNAHGTQSETLHSWNEQELRNCFTCEDENLLERLDPLTTKANLALCIACGEWICHRFVPLDSDPRPLQYLEAAWASLIDRLYCNYTVLPDEDWQGNIRGPLSIVVVIVNDAIFDDNDYPAVAPGVCLMRGLARKMLTSAEAFDAWFEIIITRLERFHTKAIDVSTEEEDLFAPTRWQGSPIPREAMDPEFDYGPGKAPTMLHSFLRQLEPQQNPFLRSVEEILYFGGVGQVPYQYNLNNDTFA